MSALYWLSLCGAADSRLRSGMPKPDAPLWMVERSTFGSCLTASMKERLIVPLFKRV